MNMNKNGIAWLIVAAAFIASAVTYSDLPAQMPIHWNINNEIDRYANKAVAVFLMPVLMALCTILFQLSPRFDRRKQNVEKFKSSLAVIQNVLLLGLLVLEGFIIAYGYGVNINVGMIVPPMIGVLFVAIGNYMPRFKPNSYVGIKTHYTLNNETVWRKTHQTAAIFYVLGGLLMIATVFVPSPLQGIVFVSIAIIVAVSPLLLSFYYAKRET